MCIRDRFLKVCLILILKLSRVRDDANLQAHDVVDALAKTSERIDIVRALVANFQVGPEQNWCQHQQHFRRAALPAIMACSRSLVAKNLPRVFGLTSESLWPFVLSDRSPQVRVVEPKLFDARRQLENLVSTNPIAQEDVDPIASV